MTTYIARGMYTAFIFLIACSSPSRQGNTNSLLYFEDSNHAAVPVTTKAEWEKKRTQVLENMQQVMGELPERTRLPDFDVKFTDSLREDGYTRYAINFLVAQDERITAYLYIPNTTERSATYPAMLALHETDPLGKGSVDGQGINKNLAYAKELAQKGYIVIAPDYPGFGEMQDYDFNTDRYESGTMKGIFDHMRCVDLLQGMSNVDPEKIGVIGHSLGGHNAIFVGAFDPRLKIVVSSCGWTLFDYYNTGERAIERYGHRLGPWAIPRYMPLLREKYGMDSTKIPFDFDEVIAAIAPRVFFSNSPAGDKNFDVTGVKKGIEESMQVYRFLKVPENLQVYYPDTGHDFPPEIRMKSYEMIDKVLKN